MITVLIECKDQDHALAATLAALVPGAVEGLVADVVIIDRGSSEATAQLAEAAGCRWLEDPDLDQAVLCARADWVMLLEPGARPQIGWIEHVGQHLAAGRQAARMRPSRKYGLSFMERWSRRIRMRRRASALEHGVVMPKRQAIANARSGKSIESLARGVEMTRLDCEIVPASAFRS